MAVVVVVHIGVALVVVHIGVSLVVMHIGVSLVVVHIWVALVVVNWSGLWLRLGLGSTALLILFVVGQWVIEGRKSGLSWAVSSGPGPLILNGLGQAANDRSTLVGDG